VSQSALGLAPTLAIIDGVPTTTSNEVAEFFGKEHAKVLRSIELLAESNRAISGGVDFNARNFSAVEYTDAKGECRPAYRLTRDGFVVLAMGFTGKRALAFKLAYIDAFNRMEAALRGPQETGLVTAAQAGELATLIARQFPEGRERPYAWSRFNNHFRIARYRELPAARFSEACAYIGQMTPRALAAAPLVEVGLIRSIRCIVSVGVIGGGFRDFFLRSEQLPFKPGDVVTLAWPPGAQPDQGDGSVPTLARQSLAIQHQQAQP
jgi:Rha family phage regulatory protein